MPHAWAGLGCLPQGSHPSRSGFAGGNGTQPCNELFSSLAYGLERPRLTSLQALTQFDNWWGGHTARHSLDHSRLSMLLSPEPGALLSSSCQ